jgi:hypothetical protein
MRTLTNSGYLTGSRIRISNSGGTSKGFGNLNEAFEKADRQSSACDFETRFKIFEFFTIISGLRNNVQNPRRLPVCRNKHFEGGFSKDLQN